MRRRPPMSLEDAALAVVRRLREHGHEALWAGGCVRDMLLGTEPADIDVATGAPPDAIVKLFRRTRKVGVQFGVVLVGQGRHWIETATFRTDLDYRDGRRPEQVVFTTAEEDTKRRDFTINGLFYDPLERKVIDYVDGQADLDAKIIRAIGNPEERFAEDHLRMLRAVRFACRLGFTIDPATAEAITRHADRIQRISAERVREELEKMLAHPSRVEAVNWLARLGLLVHLPLGCTWPDGRLARARQVLTALPKDADLILALAALLADTPATEAARMARNLRCSNQQTGDLSWLLARCGQLDQVADMRPATFKKLAVHPRFSDLLALHQAVGAADGRPLEANRVARRRLAGIPRDQLAPPPLVTGEDLIALGLQPGPDFSRILDTMYDAQLDGEIADRPTALIHLRKEVEGQ